MKRKKYIGKTGPRIPLHLPCGCKSSRGKSTKEDDVLMIEDDLRVCRHVKIWKLKWVQVYGKSRK